MKKLMTVFAAAAFAATAHCAQNDALVSFSTPGPDTYADGSAVLDGECYALVWTPASSTFALAADGTSTGGEIVLTAPVAVNGHCPNIVFQVPASKIESKYKNGSWGVYLLDTRRYDEGGKVSLAGFKDDGKLVLVNAASAIESSKVSVAKGSTSTAGAIGAACAANSTEVPAGAKKPEIKAIKIAGGNVYITVGGTMPFMQYDIIGGTSPEAVTEHANSPLTGKEGGDIILVAPAKGTSGFYRVGRN